MIQDILPYKYDNRYVEQQPDDDAFLVLIGENHILVKIEENCLFFPKWGELSVAEADTTYLFSVSDEKFFYTESEAMEEELRRKGYAFIPLSSLQRLEPKWRCFAGETAYQLGSWYRNNRYCGRCGETTHKDPHERMLYCDTCKNAIYPKICPAVIVAVTNGEKLLLAKYANGSSKHYALIAGFAEVGETIEETVHREVWEETGLEVENLRFYKSQPWSFSDTLLFGFFCDLKGAAEISVDHSELAMARWVAREDIPEEPKEISLTYEMMARFKNQR